jgi:hypothetical protein
VTTGDRPRFLGRTVGYTAAAHRSIDPAAECVTEEEQRELTARAHRRWTQEQARAWGQAATEIGRAIETFVRHGHPDRQLLNDVKAIERSINGRLGL